jgi:hypothetical protein
VPDDETPEPEKVTKTAKKAAPKVGKDEVLFVHKDGRKVAVPRGSMTERRYRRFSAWREG